ncbi:hypothetical protein BI040_gp59 [Escherichia phage vB_EcoS_NBD2]|uniref:Uncharacterized protein n=1 Tax=Escherichia phage vB_EcoS_NBD2 TaxID=1852563 RepID=A0A192Y9L8_9CAUD|nr:hypothetical protein BI040_gp59 [Escherichia phage vB_EcoS_NBD2]ANM45895.1 hypothetical protein NBD2_53 [Escherichia phage vB_EcoS_NBD2]
MIFKHFSCCTIAITRNNTYNRINNIDESNQSRILHHINHKRGFTDDTYQTASGFFLVHKR